MTECLDAVVACRVQWIQSLSEEQRAAFQADREAVAGSEEVKQERLQEAQATFQCSDTNDDGMLDRAEFEDFLGKVAQNAEARGVPAQKPEDMDEPTRDALYTFFDALDGSVAGNVSFADCLTGLEQINAKCAEQLC